MIVAELTSELGRGAEIKEIREAYEQTTGRAAPRSFTSEVSSLKKRGVLTMVGGRTGHSLYAPAGSDLKGNQKQDDNALLVLRAVRVGHRRLGRALSTREVGKELDRLDLELSADHPNAVRKYLETLSRDRTRGPVGFRAAKVARIDAEANTGRPSAHWAPAGAVDEDGNASTAPRSAAEAIRASVAAASRDLGRPVSARELRWWHDTPWAVVVHGGQLGRRTIGTVLSDTVGADSEYDGQSGRLHELRTWWTCHGGPPPRYTLGRPTRLHEHLCEFEDLLVIFRPADEMRSIQGVNARADLLGSEPLRALADIRSKTIISRFAESVERDLKAEVVEASARTQKTLAGWYSESRGLSKNQREKRRRRFNRWCEQIEKGFDLVVRRPEQVSSIRTIGSGATAELGDFDDLIAAAGKWLELEDRAARGLISRARRVPAYTPLGRERFGAADEISIARVDRVDALLALWELFPVPRATALLKNASDAIGFVLRDAALLRTLMDNMHAGDDPTRRTFVVALGLLGHLVEAEKAIPDRNSYDDTTAWILAAVLADWKTAKERVAECDAAARGPARRVTDTALMRLDAGAPFSVVG